MSHVVCVTGMHRSGTSLVMSWLERCGLQVSNGQQVPAGGGNEKGHFEDSDFYKIHLRTIAGQIPASKGWIVTNPKPLHELRLDTRLQEEIVQKRNRAYSIWGWKDPRTVFFLEAWRDQIPDLNVLVIWRPCQDVIDSLLRRARKRRAKVVKISLLQALRLWKASYRLVLDYHVKHPQRTLILPLYDIIKDDDRALNFINRTFQTELKYSPLSYVYDPSMLRSQTQLFLPRLVRFDPEVRQLTSELERRSFHVSVDAEPLDKCA